MTTTNSVIICDRECEWARTKANVDSEQNEREKLFGIRLDFTYPTLYSSSIAKLQN